MGGSGHGVGELESGGRGEGSGGRISARDRGICRAPRVVGHLGFAAMSRSARSNPGHVVVFCGMLPRRIFSPSCCVLLLSPFFCISARRCPRACRPRPADRLGARHVRRCGAGRLLRRRRRRRRRRLLRGWRLASVLWFRSFLDLDLASLPAAARRLRRRRLPRLRRAPSRRLPRLRTRFGSDTAGTYTVWSLGTR